MFGAPFEYAPVDFSAQSSQASSPAYQREYAITTNVEAFAAAIAEPIAEDALPTAKAYFEITQAMTEGTSNLEWSYALVPPAALAEKTFAVTSLKLVSNVELPRESRITIKHKDTVLFEMPADLNSFEDLQSIDMLANDGGVDKCVLMVLPCDISRQHPILWHGKHGALFTVHVSLPHNPTEELPFVVAESERELAMERLKRDYKLNLAIEFGLVDAEEKSYARSFEELKFAEIFSNPKAVVISLPGETVECKLSVPSSAPCKRIRFARQQQQVSDDRFLRNHTKNTFAAFDNVQIGDVMNLTDRAAAARAAAARAVASRAAASRAVADKRGLGDITFETPLNLGGQSITVQYPGYTRGVLRSCFTHVRKLVMDLAQGKLYFDDDFTESAPKESESSWWTFGLF